MQRPFFTLVFLAILIPGKAQQKVPVFANPEDSIAYFSTEQWFSKATRNPRYTARIDSLFRVMNKLREKAARFRTVYSTSVQYTRYNQRPKDLLSITKLSLVDYKGTSLPDSLYLMKNLKELELINTRIRKLPKRLNEFQDLTKVTLYNNRPRGRVKLTKNSHVKQLGIHDDERDLRPRSYRNFTALETLDLSRNNLVEFPKLRGVRSLRKLAMTDNLLTLQKMPASPPNLEDLVLTSNRIQTLPSEISGYTRLKKLNLTSNQVSALPPEIGKLQALEELSLYKNRIEKLPTEIYRLKKLRIIDLYYNQLSELDTAIRNWTRMEILYAANNGLFTLPDNLGALKNLRELYIHHNRLSSLPASIGELDSLRVLRANDNLLVELPESILRLRNLENLDVGFNQMSSIPQGLFELPKLEILGLKRIPLEEKIRSNAIDWSRKAMARRKLIIHLDGLVDSSSENQP